MNAETQEFRRRAEANQRFAEEALKNAVALALSERDCAELRTVAETNALYVQQIDAGRLIALRTPSAA